MQTIYQYDGNNIYTGVSEQIADDAGCPLGWTFSVPPPIPAGKYAYYLAPDWIIIDQYPASTESAAPVAAPGEAPAVI
jgi:hypothetical protein